MTSESGISRVGMGCGGAAIFVLATIAITFGGIMLQQLHPGYVARPGAGQGEGMLGGMVMLATPVIGLLAAWRARVGVALGALILLALLAFHIVAIAQI